MRVLVDTSSNNGEVDFENLKVSYGIEGAIIRCGYGNNEPSQDDTQFEPSCTACDRAGLPKGTYLYSYALSIDEAHSEAAHVLRLIQGKEFPLGIFIDMEDADGYKARHGLSPYTHGELYTEICRVFWEDLEAAGYGNVGLYTNMDFRQHVLDMSQLAGMIQWVAWWRGTSDPAARPEDCQIWQYASGNSSLSPTGLDMNYDYRKTDSGSGTQVNAVYRVSTREDGWLPPVENLTDYAGIQGHQITGVAIQVSEGNIQYRVHVLGGGWLPWVTGYDIENYENGFAGNGTVIDTIEVYYYTPQSIVEESGYKRSAYRVSPLWGNYYPWQYDTEQTEGQDGYAGVYGAAIDRFQIQII